MAPVELANEFGLFLYGMTPAEAIEHGICVRCKQPPEFYSKAGKEEYQLSGLCEPCFDEEFSDEDV